MYIIIIVINILELLHIKCRTYCSPLSSSRILFDTLTMWELRSDWWLPRHFANEEAVLRSARTILSEGSPEIHSFLLRMPGIIFSSLSSSARKNNPPHRVVPPSLILDARWLLLLSLHPCIALLLNHISISKAMWLNISKQRQNKIPQWYDNQAKIHPRFE